MREALPLARGSASVGDSMLPSTGAHAQGHARPVVTAPAPAAKENVHPLTPRTVDAGAEPGNACQEGR